MTWIVLIVFAVILLCLLAWRFDGRKAKTHGSAGWSTIWTAFKSGLLKKKGLRLGDWTGRKSLFYDGAHALTFGSTGSGKGTSAILPNLLQQSHLFVVDPGGENTAVAIRRWRTQGYSVGCINPFGMFAEAPWALPAQGFNPLDFLSAGSPTFAADSLLFAEMLTPRAGQESGSTTYFKDAAQTAKRAMIIHIKTTERPENQNIGTLYSYVTLDGEDWRALIAAMKASRACGGLVSREAIKLERIEEQSPEEFSAIMSTIQQDMSFLADPLVREKLSRSDVDYSALKGHAQNHKGAVISVILPLEYVESHAAITRLALACAVLTIQRKPYAANKITFILDEAAALGKMLRFPNWLATLRKYRASFWSIWQNVGQIVHLYDKNWQTIIGNCGLVQVLSVGDLETAEYIERYIGRSTVKTISVSARGEVSTSQSARPLLMADELLRLREDRQIVFIGNHWPFVLSKTAYWKRPELAGRFNPNPYHDGETPNCAMLDHAMKAWGEACHVLVWWLAPHPLAALIMVAPFALFVANILSRGS